jgi:hypothetical protein
MANRKISDLTALTATATGDLLPIVDISEAGAVDQNKKITIENLFKGIPGNVGIGTTSPSELLNLSGDSNPSIQLTATNDTTPIINWRSLGTDRLRLFSSSAVGACLDVRSNQHIQFNTNSTERARIDSSGRLLVGTSTTGLQNTRSMLWQGFGEAALYINHSTSDGSGDPFIKFGYNAGQIGSITQSGTTAVAYNTSSDYRLKGNITPVSDGITRLQQLNPSRFNFIADPDRTVDGFIAHEAQAVVPECVTGTKDEVDEDGNPVYQGIDQSKLVPLLTAALQEAIAKIETLEARLTAAGIA